MNDRPEEKPPRDLLERLLREYRDTKDEHDASPDEDEMRLATRFVEFARRRMQENQATGLDYTVAGLSLRFQDGTSCKLSDVPDQTTGGVQGGYEMAEPQRRQTGEGESWSMGITTGDIGKR